MTAPMTSITTSGRSRTEATTRRSAAQPQQVVADHSRRAQAGGRVFDGHENVGTHPGRRFARQADHLERPAEQIDAFTQRGAGPVRQPGIHDHLAAAGDRPPGAQLPGRGKAGRRVVAGQQDRRLGARAREDDTGDDDVAGFDGAGRAGGFVVDVQRQDRAGGEHALSAALGDDQVSANVVDEGAQAVV
jgi:hypothetical protein